MNPRTVGQVILVGAGPGDAGLISLRGIEWMQRADVVLYDYLVNPEILKHTTENCETVCLGQHGRSKIWPQQRICDRLVQEANDGKTVIRLKSGDPIVFGRAADELDALVANQIPFEIVPGITAALAAGAYGGIPITHRDQASAVALITGQESASKTESSLNYDALARFPGTLVIYMGVTTAPQWTAGLLNAGMSGETPVAIIRRCSWPNQKIIRCSLAEVVDHLTPYSKFPPPAIAIVGAVAQTPNVCSWFETRPLHGNRILVCRPREQAELLGELLAEQGADVLYQPAIRIDDPEDWTPVDEAISRIEEFDWLVFSSANGVRRLLNRILKLGFDMRVLASIKIATIGPITANTLSEFGLKSDLQPAEYRAEALAATLSTQADGKRFLLARASRGRQVLAEQLKSAGGVVEQIVVYSSTDTAEPDPQIKQLLRDGQIRWTVVTSSAIARSIYSLFGSDLQQTQLASISPITTASLAEVGLTPKLEATEYSMAGLVKAIVSYGS